MRPLRNGAPKVRFSLKADLHASRDCPLLAKNGPLLRTDIVRMRIVCCILSLKLSLYLYIQTFWCLNIALSIVMNFLMQTVIATFLGFSRAMRRIEVTNLRVNQHC